MEQQCNPHDDHDHSTTGEILKDYTNTNDPSMITEPDSFILGIVEGEPHNLLFSHIPCGFGEVIDMRRFTIGLQYLIDVARVHIELTHPDDLRLAVMSQVVDNLSALMDNR